MKKVKLPKIIVFGIVIVIILAIVAFYKILNSNKNNYDYSKMTKEEKYEAVEQEIEKSTLRKLSKMNERERMEYYVSEFMTDIENKDYEAAYEKLYSEFKTKFFPTLDSFEEYATKKFPKLCSMNYNNIERNGDVYVLWIKMNDLFGSKDSSVDMNFVIRENNLNDFEMSFSVK